MNSAERIAEMTTRLQAAFSPSQLDILDDSEQHKGHEGARGGAGHYTVIISAEKLKNVSRVAAHQQIYAVLNDLIPHEVHALRITIR